MCTAFLTQIIVKILFSRVDFLPFCIKIAHNLNLYVRSHRFVAPLLTERREAHSLISDVRRPTSLCLMFAWLSLSILSSSLSLSHPVHNSTWRRQVYLFFPPTLSTPSFSKRCPAFFCAGSETLFSHLLYSVSSLWTICPYTPNCRPPSLG